MNVVKECFVVIITTPCSVLLTTQVDNILINFFLSLMLKQYDGFLYLKQTFLVIEISFLHNNFYTLIENFFNYFFYL